MAKSKEFDCPTETMSARTEAGFFFSSAKLEEVRQTLKSLGYQQIFYENPYTQSIYFADRKRQTPSGGYVRLRRYSSSPKLEEFSVSPDSLWYLEGKVSGGAKERILVPAGEALEVLANPGQRERVKPLLPTIYALISETEPMFPIAATQWLREHYILDDRNRATIDSQLTYFGFITGILTGQKMGQDTGNRIEWKSLDGYIPANKFNGINLSAIPPKWHEATIRKMYIEWLSDKTNDHD